MKRILLIALILIGRLDKSNNDYIVSDTGEVVWIKGDKVYNKTNSIKYIIKATRKEVK